MKRLSKYCLSFIIALMMLMPLSVYGAGNDLESINMDVQIDDDGSAKIVEKWQGSYYQGTEGYKCWYNMGNSRITDFSVSDDRGVTYQTLNQWDIDASFDEKANKCGIVYKGGDDYELCFGMSEYGPRTYTMTYTIHNFIIQYNDYQGFNYQLISEEMKPMPNNVDIKISSTKPFYDSNTDIYGFGYQGQVVFDDQGSIYMSNKDMDNGSRGSINYMNILAKCENGDYRLTRHIDSSFKDVLEDAKKGSSYDDGFPIWIIAMFVITIIFGVILSVVMLSVFGKKFKKRSLLQYTDGNNQDIKESEVNYFRDIPCHGDLFYFYYVCYKAGILTDEDRGGLIAAVLLKWVRDGYVNFTKEEGSGFFKKDKIEIEFFRDIPTEYNLEEELEGFFKEAASRNGNQILENKEFEKWCKSHYEEIETWFTKLKTQNSNLLESQGLLQKKTVMKKILFFTVPDIQITYTPEFREDIKQVIGFKKFLKEFSSIEDKGTIEVKLWEDYLIFASVLGLADQVEKELGRLCPEFNQYSHIDYTYTCWATYHFCHAGMHSASRAYAAAHSSSSSGGGGSSSFGGGGGGFSGGGGGGFR